MIENEIKIMSLQHGRVLKNDDPKKLGRVIVQIPGIAPDGTPWAYPAGTVGGGSLNSGFVAVPKVGSQVVVFYQLGDPEVPFYFCGHWTKGADIDPEISFIQFGNNKITFNEKENTLKIEGQRGSVFIDGETGNVTVNGVVNANVTAKGGVVVSGATITLNGRPVNPFGGPI